MVSKNSGTRLIFYKVLTLNILNCVVHKLCTKQCHWMHQFSTNWELKVKLVPKCAMASQFIITSLETPLYNLKTKQNQRRKCEDRKGTWRKFAHNLFFWRKANRCLWFKIKLFGRERVCSMILSLTRTKQWKNAGRTRIFALWFLLVADGFAFSNSTFYISVLNLQTIDLVSKLKWQNILKVSI